MGYSADYSLYFVSIIGLYIPAKIVSLGSVSFLETDEIEVAII